MIRTALELGELLIRSPMVVFRKAEGRLRMPESDTNRFQRTDHRPSQVCPPYRLPEVLRLPERTGT